MSTTLTIYLSACLAWATRTTAGLTLEHCGGLDSSDRYAEVVSGNSRNELTCSGIDGITIEWKFNDYSAGICPPPPLSFRDNNYITTDYNNDSTADTCNMDTALPEVFVASRRSSSRSTLTINPVMLGPKVSFLQYITLRCLQQGNGVTTSDSCPLDYVRPANGTCVADVEDTSCCSQNGTITCDVSMGYSTHNRYGCRFFYRFGVNASQELGEWQPFVSSSSPFPDNDSAVSCFLAFSLSVPQGEQPEFSVMLLPGRSIVPAVVLSGNGSTVIITNSAQAQYTVIIFPTLIIVIIAVIIGTLLLTRRYGCPVRRGNCSCCPASSPESRREIDEAGETHQSSSPRPACAERQTYDELYEVMSDKTTQEARDSCPRPKRANSLSGSRRKRDPNPQPALAVSTPPHDENEYELGYD